MISDGSEDGLKEDEYEASVATLQSLAATLEADCVLLRQSKADHGLTGQYLVRRRLDRQDFLEIRFLFNGFNFLIAARQYTTYSIRRIML